MVPKFEERRSVLERGASEPPKVMYSRHLTHQNMVKNCVSESQVTTVHHFRQVNVNFTS